MYDRMTEATQAMDTQAMTAESDFIVAGSSPFTAGDASAFSCTGATPFKRRPGRPRLHREEDVPEVKRQTAQLHYYRNREKAIEMKRAYYNANRENILAKKRRAYHLKKSAEKGVKLTEA